MESRGSTVLADRRCEASSIDSALETLWLEAGLTEAELARELGMTQSEIARIEAGRCRTSLEAGQRAAFGCDLGLVYDRHSRA